VRDIDDDIKGIKEQRGFAHSPNDVLLCERCFRRPAMTYPPNQTDLDQGIEIHRDRYCSTCQQSLRSA